MSEEAPLFAPQAEPEKTTSEERRTPATDERRTAATDEAWLVMIVDDEQGVHDITTLALKKFRFQGKKLKFIHAYSRPEAEKMIVENPDTALMLLDVVMDSDDAGLLVANFVRNEAKNSFVRIVLRTGQPGAAPESKVIHDYDINDYKDKTELTAQKLTTTLFASLRSYRDIIALDKNRKGLERVVYSTSELFKTSGMKEFVSGLLLQISSVMGLSGDTLLASSPDSASSFIAGCNGNDDGICSDSNIIAGTGRFSSASGKTVSSVVRGDDLELICKAIKEEKSCCGNGNCVFYFKNKAGSFGFVYITNCEGVNSIDQKLIEMFCANISIAYENISLYREIEDTQSEVIHTLGSIAEFRSKETSQHVSRVAAFSELLALKSGMDPKKATLLHLASPMHDIGKVGIPDNILNKPGKLTDEEFVIMKSHAQIGYDMLKGSDRPILHAAAIVAHQHQEKWDGSGYPQGLAGEDIHVYGRISAVADVFDALSHKRCYKDAWTEEQVKTFFEEQTGKHFDPVFAGILLDNIDEFQRIRKELDDLDS